ncbi:hypothetical protein BpHYR1_053377 [Brachionus plicatilis]|uniref:Uncharacterized protein n=1 Tax=Brachionus plicatilis TaxID=10195 RepID=A0A3M7P3A8_BRAPC|nr:hypothetical protein BpHYR1_053377 [Brachionus plicatilis]
MFDSLLKKFSTQRQSSDSLSQVESSMLELSSLKLQSLNIHNHEEHVYEEIQDSNPNHYYSSLSNEVSKNRKCVRFNNRTEPVKTNTLTSILKKPCHDSTESDLSSSTASSCSFSAFGYYTNNSISSTNSSNSSSSSHSLVFNQIVDDFLSRLPDRSEKKKGVKTNSDKKSKKEVKKSSSACVVKGGESNDARLSFRVTNLTLDDLKQRQKAIYLNSLHKPIVSVENHDELRFLMSKQPIHI